MRPVHRLILCGVALLSCAPEVVVAPPEPGTVTVTVADNTILQGATTQATAEATDSRGRLLTSEPRIWTSSQPLIASVSATGMVTALLPGSAEIRASVLGRTSGAAVTVLPRVARVVLTPDTATRTYGDTLRFTAAAFSRDSNPMPAATFEYSISTGSTLAAISSTGLVTPVLQFDTLTRTVVVRATSDTASGTATLRLRKLPVDTVIVSPASATRLVGETVLLSAQPRRATGSNLTQRVVTWSSSNPGIASVDANTGLVTAVSVGTVAVYATSEGKVTAATITVGNTPVQTVDVVLPQSTTPLTALSLGSGRTQQLGTVLKDASGNVVTGRTVTWSSSTPAIVSVSTSGVVTAAAVSGSATITATSEGQSDSISVTIGNAVASVTMPTSFAISTVQTASSTGNVRDAGLAALPNRAVTITSTNSSIVTVTPNATQSNASGIFSYSIRGVAAGTASIIATSEGLSDTSAVTVSTAVVAQVTWDGYLALTASPTVGLGRQVQASVTPRDNLGNAIPGRSVVWTSSVPASVTVSSTGVVSGAAPGSSVITATVDGVAATRSFSTQNAVATIQLSSSSVSGVVNLQTSVTVTPRDAGNTALTARPFTAVSTDTTIARVAVIGTNTIQVTNLREGATTITLASEGITATLNVTVTPPPVASVEVTGGTTLTTSSTLQLAATTRDAAGNVLTGRRVTWTSSNTSAASVDSSGLVTGVGVGSTVITATSEGVNGTRSLSVTTDVSSVTVTPSSFSLNVGATQQLTATPRNASGTELTGRTVVWSSLNTGVATVNSSGLVSAVGVGTATIRATVDGVIGSATATVNTAVNACDPVSHSAGTTVSGSVATTDCLVTAGSTYEDIYSLTSTGSRLMSWNVTPSGGTLLVIRQALQNTSSGPFISTTFSTAGMAYTLYGSGTHRFSVRNSTTPPVGYSFTTNGAAVVPNECVVVSAAIGGGISANLSLGTSSCLANSKRYGRIWLYLTANQQVTINMTSTFDTFLELYPLNGDGTVGARTAFDDDGGGGTNSRLIFTASSAGFFELRTTTFDQNVTGAYSLTMQTTPVAILAPDESASMMLRTPESRP